MSGSHDHAQEDRQEDGRDQVHDLDLGQIQHVQAQRHDHQRTHTGHLRDDCLAQKGLQKGGGQGDSPWYKKMPTAEKATPTPREEAKTMELMPSSTDLAFSVS